jgi:hypothetical protein
VLDYQHGGLFEALRELELAAARDVA